MLVIGGCKLSLEREPIAEVERVDKEAEGELGVRVGRQRPARRPVVGREIGSGRVALAEPVEGEQPARPPAEVCERVKIRVAEGESGARAVRPHDRRARRVWVDLERADELLAVAGHVDRHPAHAERRAHVRVQERTLRRRRGLRRLARP